MTLYAEILQILEAMKSVLMIVNSLWHWGHFSSTAAQAPLQFQSDISI